MIRAPRLTGQQLLVLIIAIGVTAASWHWIVVMARDMYGPMDGASAWMMPSQPGSVYWLLLWCMWAVMMAAMMLPSALPLLMLLARADRSHGTPARYRTRALAFGAGYLLVWSVFSLFATALQGLLSASALLTPMMEPVAPTMSAVLLVAAGTYQFSPLKNACLAACRSPLGFVMGNWRPGWRGALNMGLHHGVYCLGCCWALMLLLFAAGIMNLTVILLLAAWVLVEKLLPMGETGARLCGAVLLIAGVWMLLR